MKKNLLSKIIALTFFAFIGASFCSAMDMRLGVFADYEPTVGDLHEFVHCSVGGGIDYEVGFKLPFNLELGPAVHLAANANPVRDERLSSMMNLKMDAGAFLRVPILKTGLSFVPEVDYGCLVYFPKVSPDYSGDLETAYADQLIQVGLGIRFAHEKLLSGDLEFDVTPTYLFSTEKENSVHYIGFRVGVSYRVFNSERRSAQNQQQGGQYQDGQQQ